MASRNAVQEKPSGGKGRPWQGLHVRPLNVEKGAERVRTVCVFETAKEFRALFYT